ncbi:MAG: 2-oxo acid dehydrogenase subunit E2 [Myxococcales bacterium]|nr:2-oxo acid dehydrogenase subunit E2 [Myxococcales bacterium]
MSLIEFKLPEIGEGVVEGEIVAWLKRPGEAIAANEALVEVMTDKATIEVPSPLSGVVLELRAEVGDICAVGQVIAALGPAGAAPRTEPAATPVSSATSEAGAQVLATPAARALARESGIDLAALPVDARGRITKSDVIAARERAAAPAKTPPAPVAAPPARAPAPPARQVVVREGDEELPFRGMRRRIAEGLTRSYTTAVHYTYVEQINVTKLVRLRDEAKALAAEQGVALSYLPFIIKAVVHGLRKFPIVNAELDEAGARILIKRRYSIGVATATEQGLLVPVVHDADRRSILDLAREVARLSEATRAGKATRDELTGSTFTVSSLGLIGGVMATPIINYPEVGILGVHAIRKTPVVDEHDNIVIGHLMNLSVSLDHRVVDGFEGAQFLQEVRRYLEDPNMLLLAGI